jgi:hypothetical protein
MEKKRSCNNCDTYCKLLHQSLLYNHDYHHIQILFWCMLHHHSGTRVTHRHDLKIDKHNSTLCYMERENILYTSFMTILMHWGVSGVTVFHTLVLLMTSWVWMWGSENKTYALNCFVTWNMKSLDSSIWTRNILVYFFCITHKLLEEKQWKSSLILFSSCRNPHLNTTVLLR